MVSYSSILLKYRNWFSSKTSFLKESRQRKQRTAACIIKTFFSSIIIIFLSYGLLDEDFGFYFIIDLGWEVLSVD
jgi:hypothetical protein